MFRNRNHDQGKRVAVQSVGVNPLDAHLRDGSLSHD